MTATILRDRAGHPLVGLGMIQDITERKHMEAKLEGQPGADGGFRAAIRTWHDGGWNRA